MQPFWYYLAGVVLFSLNILLLLILLKKLTGNLRLALVATGFAALHRENEHVWYNFGALYELLIFGLMVTSLYLYLSFVETEKEGRKSYWMCLFFFIAALNAKETAVVLPLIFALYEMVYKAPQCTSMGYIYRAASRLAPLLAISAVYTAGKVLGEETYWDNSRYKYHFDESIYHHLHQYFDLVFYKTVHFNDSSLAWTLASLLVVAFWLKSRHMLFGLGFFLLALLPVLPLPRLWGLFLHVPMIGLSLCLAALVFELGKRWGPALLGVIFSRWEIRRQASWVCIAVLFSTLHLVGSDWIRRGYQSRLHNREPWRRFSEQLLDRYPNLASESALAFEDAPLPAYSLHFLIWLKYENPQIQIFVLPDEEQNFLRVRQDMIESHRFKYDNGELIEISEPEDSKAYK
jgi:hypothetical protein